VISPCIHAVLDLGNAYLKKKDMDAAEKALREAIQLDPSLSRAHHLLGIALRRQGNMKESEMEFARARVLAVSEHDRVSEAFENHSKDER
jgi:Tfp pilus assembly protein PilF